MSEKKVGKRLLTWVLVLVMTLSLLPLNVLADEIPLDEPTGEEAMIETGDATFDEPELAAYQNRKSTTKDAQFYYLKSPNSNPDKNDSSEFGPKLGNGTIDIKDLDFKFDWDSFSYKNAYNVGGCVISWPDNVGDGGVLAKNTTPGSDWMTIFNAFKSDYEDKNGIQAGTLTTGDVISITLKPHKVSRYNSTRPDHHVDCTVEIICNGVQNVRFFVKDASASEYQQHGKGQSVMVGNAVTFPTDLLQTKTVDGVDYTFKGWYLGSYDNTAPNTSSTAYDNGDNPYTVNEGGKNIGFYAYYEPVATNTYTITWYDEDGTTVLGTRENVPYGTSAEEVEKLAPANPTKTSDAQYDYTFKSWDKPYAEVTDNQTYTAQFDKTTRKYEITWVVDGNTVKTENVEYGTSAEEVEKLAPANPTKTSDAQYDYTFKSWDKPYAEVTDNQTYTAQFDKTTRKYEITWVVDGNTVKTENVGYGTSAEEVEKLAPANPTKASDTQFDYTFKGWTPEYDKVTGDQTYTAQFDKTTRSYEIKWVVEGKTVKTENAKYGTSAEDVEKLAPADPTKASDTQFDYTFKGWDKPYAEVTGNQTYTAQFTETTRKYTIIWYDEDGTTVLGTATLPYGASADQVKAKAPADPTKAASGRYTYKFDKWTPDYAPVEGNQVYKATYKSTYHRPSTPTKPTVEIEDDDALGLNTTDHFAYIVGYGNGEVRPQNNITRAEVATIFFRLLTDDVRDENLTKTNRYSDVTRADWYNTAVSTLSSMGIITGYPDGTFRPNAAITRAEFAAIAARFDNDGDKTAAKFSDIATHWAKDEISIAYNNGWITGYPDGTFGPQRDITRAETMTLVNRVLNRQPETEDDLLPNMTVWTDNANPNAWYYLAVQEATNSHYYKFKTNSKYEKWTELRETRDWTLLEK